MEKQNEESSLGQASGLAEGMLPVNAGWGGSSDGLKNWAPSTHVENLN